MNNQEDTRTLKQCQVAWRNAYIEIPEQDKVFSDCEEKAKIEGYTFENCIWLLDRLPFSRSSEKPRFVELAKERAKTSKQCKQICEIESSMQVPSRASDKRRINYSIIKNWIGFV